MLFIILKSSACLAVFMLFYKFCLEKTSAHIFKRIYLIGIILISIAIPFITFTEYVLVEPFNSQLLIEPLNNSEIVFSEVTQPKNYLPTILWSIYSIGVMLFLIRFFKNLFQIIQKIRLNPKYKNQNFINVLLQDLFTPHTFFNYIFLNKAKFENNQIPKEVFVHEQTHAKQKHALDILFIEILQIVFWFNPLLYFIKKDIKLNHEFLADQAVINKGSNTKYYQQLLLAFSSNASHSSLANAINYSLIKKRFTVMKTQTPKAVLWIRSLIILPLIAILIYGFSEEKKVIIENSIFTDKETPQMLHPKEKKENKLNKTDEKLEPFKNLKLNYSENQQKKDSLINDVIILINEKNQIFLNNKITNIDNLLYAINDLNPNLTIAQKRKFLYGKINHQTNTSKDLIKKIQNIFNEAGIWSYGTQNSEVSAKNGLKNNFPGFPFTESENLSKEDKILYKYQLKKYNEWLLINNSKKKLEETEKGYVIKDENGKITFSSDPTIKAEPFELKKDSPWKISTGITNVTFEESADDMQQKATPEEIEEYNNIVKKLNSYPENRRIIKQNDVERITFIFNKMNEEQKANAEPFPDFPPPPPPPMDTIYTYNRLAKRVQTVSKNREANVIYLKEIYGKMSASQKSKVNAPETILNSIKEEEEILNNNQTIDLSPITKSNSPWKVTVGVNAIQSNDFILNNKNSSQKKATKQDIDEYNLLTKKFNLEPENRKNIKVIDFTRLHELYGLMNENQKNIAEPFPDYITPLKSNEQLIIDIINNGAICYIDNKETTTEKAIAIINEKTPLRVSTENKGSNTFIKLYTKDFKE